MTTTPRMTDDAFEQNFQWMKSNVSSGTADAMLADHRHAREAEARYIEALKGVSDSPAAGRDGPLLAICTARYALGLKDLITDELTKLTFGLKDRAEAAETERDAAVKRAEEAELGLSTCDVCADVTPASLVVCDKCSEERMSVIMAERDAAKHHAVEMEDRALRLVTERDALHSQLEEALAEAEKWKKNDEAGFHNYFVMLREKDAAVATLRSELLAARDRIGALERIGRLERALLDYCRHGEYCTLSQAIPAEDEDKHHCTCGLSAALAPGSTPVACARCVKLEKELGGLANEATAFMSLVPEWIRDNNIGYTNTRCLEKRIESARAALAPAPGEAPTREVLTPEQAEEMREEGAALSEEIKRRTAPMKRGPFEPRVDPFDMPGKGDGE